MEHLILRCWDKKSKKMRDIDSIAFHNENYDKEHRKETRRKTLEEKRGQCCLLMI